MKAKQMMVCPAMAARMLKRNKFNRKLRQFRVNQMAKAMEEGRFQETHEPIAIDENGDVLDGQHRLSAVVQSGIGHRFWVVFDAPRSTYGVVDSGMTRSHTQRLEQDGYKNAGVLSSLIRVEHSFRLTGYPGGGISAVNALSYPQMLEMVESSPYYGVAVSLTTRESVRSVMPSAYSAWCFYHALLRTEGDEEYCAFLREAMVNGQAAAVSNVLSSLNQKLWHWASNKSKRPAMTVVAGTVFTAWSHHAAGRDDVRLITWRNVVNGKRSPFPKLLVPADFE